MAWSHVRERASGREGEREREGRLPDAACLTRARYTVSWRACGKPTETVETTLNWVETENDQSTLTVITMTRNSEGGRDVERERERERETLVQSAEMWSDQINF